MVQLIGKEANRLDEVKAGLCGKLGDVVTQYIGPSTRVLQALVLPVLDRFSGRFLAAIVRIDRRTIDRIRRGQRPRTRVATELLRVAVEVAQRDLALRGLAPRLPSRSLRRNKGLALLELWRLHNPGADLGF